MSRLPKIPEQALDKAARLVAAAGRKAKGLKTTAAGILVCALGAYAAYMGHETGAAAVLVGLGLIFGVDDPNPDQ